MVHICMLVNIGLCCPIPPNVANTLLHTFHKIHKYSLIFHNFKYLIIKISFIDGLVSFEYTVKDWQSESKCSIDEDDGG